MKFQRMTNGRNSLHFYATPSITLTEQKQLIEDALSDQRLIATFTYRQYSFILCSLLHETNDHDEKPVVSYDIIGQLFKEPRTHYAFIEQYNMSLIPQHPAHRLFILTDEEIAAIKEEIKRKGDDYPSIDDISL